MQWMEREGKVEMFVEVGPGKVLSGLIRRIASESRTLSLSGIEGIEKLQKELNGSL